MHIIWVIIMIIIINTFTIIAFTTNIIIMITTVSLLFYSTYTYYIHIYILYRAGSHSLIAHVAWMNLLDALQTCSLRLGWHVSADQKPRLLCAPAP